MYAETGMESMRQRLAPHVAELIAECDRVMDIVDLAEVLVRQAATIAAVVASLDKAEADRMADEMVGVIERVVLTSKAGQLADED